MLATIPARAAMIRGYYYAVAPDGTRCPHRHYDLSRALIECWRGTWHMSDAHPDRMPRRPPGLVRYVDDEGRERPARTDEIRELETHAAQAQT